MEESKYTGEGADEMKFDDDSKQIDNLINPLSSDHDDYRTIFA